ncbi:MAG: hypothetical protein M5R42_13620 [Rhodocyclaceae bacterium]|nr:hypothetical protein [Rhodocyclaceae bacterium]
MSEVVSDSVPDCLVCGGCCAWSETWPVLMGARDGEGIPDELIDFRQPAHAVLGTPLRCAGRRTRLQGGLQRVREPSACLPEFQAGSADCLMVRRKLGFEA